MALKDSGLREEMTTGSVRDTPIGKPRPGLIPAACLLEEAIHFGEGAEKYTDDNWKRGQPIMRYWDSAHRHLIWFGLGVPDEPHLRAAIWNLHAMQWTLLAIKSGMLPKELDNRPADMLENNPMGLMLFEMVEKSRADVLKQEPQEDMQKPEKEYTKEEIRWIFEGLLYRNVVAEITEQNRKDKEELEGFPVARYVLDDLFSTALKSALMVRKHPGKVFEGHLDEPHPCHKFCVDIGIVDPETYSENDVKSFVNIQKNIVEQANNIAICSDAWMICRFQFQIEKCNGVFYIRLEANCYPK